MGAGTPWWVSLLLVLAGGALTLLGILYTQWQQGKREQVQRDRERERDHYTDARTLRDAKRERLRGHYATLLGAGWAMNDYLIDVQVRYKGETDEQYEERLAGLLERARLGVDEAMVLLTLERDATTVCDTFTQARSAFHNYRRERAEGMWDAAHHSDVILKAAVSRLDGLARRQLAELDQPIPPLMPATGEPPASASPPAAPIRRWQLRRWWRSRRQPATSEAGQAGA